MLLFHFNKEIMILLNFKKNGRELLLGLFISNSKN